MFFTLYYVGCRCSNSDLKGLSIYDKLHLSSDRLPTRTRINIARQVAQAVGYLHAKGITTKTLNSKNIYFEPKVKLSLIDQAMARVEDVRLDNFIHPTPRARFVVREGQREREREGEREREREKGEVREGQHYPHHVIHNKWEQLKSRTSPFPVRIFCIVPIVLGPNKPENFIIITWSQHLDKTIRLPEAAATAYLTRSIT